METKSVIAIMEGSVIRAVMCESGDYVKLAPCLQHHWKSQDRVKQILDQGFQKTITETENIPSDTYKPAMKFFNFGDFMRHFENDFCEDYYIMDSGVWYYAGAGERSVTPLDIKLIPLLRPKYDNQEAVCPIHGHHH